MQAMEPASSIHGAIRTGRCHRTPPMIAAEPAAPSRIHSIALSTYTLVSVAIAVCPRRDIRTAMGDRRGGHYAEQCRRDADRRRAGEIRTSAEDFGDDGGPVGVGVAGYLLPLAVGRVPFEVGETYPFESRVGGVRDQPVCVPPARTGVGDRDRQSGRLLGGRLVVQSLAPV